MTKNMTKKITKEKKEKIIKIKKRIIKESSNLEKNYKTTFKDIKKYFKIFNKAFFKDQLNPFNDIQLKKMNDWHSNRFENAKSIWDVARNLQGLRVPVIPKEVSHAAYKCYVFIQKKSLKEGWDRDRIVFEINKRGVPCFYGSCPEVYLEKAFEELSCKPQNQLSIAKELGETSLMFLVHPTLMRSEIEKTCYVLAEVMTDASQSI